MNICLSVVGFRKPLALGPTLWWASVVGTPLNSDKDLVELLTLRSFITLRSTRMRESGAGGSSCREGSSIIF